MAKIPYFDEFQQQKFAFWQFQRQKVSDQGANVVSSWWEVSLWLEDYCLVTVFSQDKKERFLFYFLLDHQAYWIRGKNGQSALCNPIDCSLSGSSVHVILQVRILE